MSDAGSAQTEGYRAGVVRTLAVYDELPIEELRTDALWVTFPAGWVNYQQISDWDRIVESIAPARSGDEFAFINSGNGVLRRKSQSRDSQWKHACWFGELVHYPRDGGGRLVIKLNLNPTRFEAFRALGRPRQGSSVEQVALTPLEKAEHLEAATLDQSTNFIPEGYRRYTYRSRREMMLAALERFRADLTENLARAGIQIVEAGDGARAAHEPYRGDRRRIVLDWRDWRLDRLEQYIEVKTPDAVNVVRRGYLDARARLHNVASRLYPDRDHPPQISSDLDRNRRAISYETRTNSQNHVAVYAKAENIVRIERRWVRGDGQPEVGFSDYQQIGFDGLVDWVQQMNPGSRDAIAPVERRLYELSQGGTDGPALWSQMCSHVAHMLDEPEDIEAFLDHIIEYGGMHRASQSRKLQMLLGRLETYRLFEKLANRENVVAVPALGAYLATLRETSEINFARQMNQPDAD